MKYRKNHLIEITAGKNIPLNPYGINAGNILYVWTVYDEDRMWRNNRFRSSDGKPVEAGDLDRLIPLHQYGAFFEEKIHDYDVDEDGNTLSYYSTLYREGDKVKLFIVTESEETDGKN